MLFCSSSVLLLSFVSFLWSLLWLADNFGHHISMLKRCYILLWFSAKALQSSQQYFFQIFNLIILIRDIFGGKLPKLLKNSTVTKTIHKKILFFEQLLINCMWYAKIFIIDQKWRPVAHIYFIAEATEVWLGLNSFIFFTHMQKKRTNETKRSLI